MQKHISIIRGTKNERFEAFHDRVKEIVAQLKAHPVQKLHYTITLERPPKVSVIPFINSKVALVSITTNTDGFAKIFENTEGYAGTCRVTEALPIAYEKDWSDGEPTPGVCLLTLFRKRKSIDQETFLHRWHNGHTPFTLKVHPIYHYNRNQVTAVAGNPELLYDGIVEEHCRSRKELLNPMKFFSKSGFAPVNMVRTYFDVKSFIDYKSIETYLVREFVVVSKPPAAGQSEEPIEPPEAL